MLERSRVGSAEGGEKGRWASDTADLDSRISCLECKFHRVPFLLSNLICSAALISVAHAISLTTYFMHLCCLVVIKRGLLILYVTACLHQALSPQQNPGVFFVTPYLMQSGLRDSEACHNEIALRWYSINQKTAFKKSLCETSHGFLGNLSQTWWALALPQAAELPAFPIRSWKALQI